MRDGDKKSDEETNTPMKNAWRSWGLGAALIIGLTVVAYLPVRRAGFVFDDHLLITDNPMVKASDGLYRFWLTADATEYYPVTWSWWWLEWRLWGNHATGYHVVNLLFHAVDAVLIWMVLRRLKIPGAWLAGLVFAVHPVNVATVAWISEQKTTLSMLFYLVAILLYLRFDEESHSPRTGVQGWRWPRPRSRGKYGLSLVAFLLALLSKTAVVMLPVVLLGCVWWRRGRVRWKDMLCSMPFFALSLVMGLVNIWFEYHWWMKGPSIRTAGMASRLAAAGWVPWFYLYKALLPVDLTVIYPQWEIDPTRWISYVPGVMLLGSFSVFWWQRKIWGRPWLFGMAYFVVTLFPVWGLVDQPFYRYSLVADHWQYYSIVGVIALAVGAGERICRRLGERGRSWGTVTAVVMLLALGTATWRRSCVYADDETLWRDNVAKNPQAWMAYNSLGFALAGRGRLTEAIAQYQQALQLKPDYAEAHNNLGNALAQAGKREEAIEQYEQALRINPDSAKAYNNLGNALLEAGRAGESIEHLREALQMKPDFGEAHYNLGVALWQVGRVAEAIGHWEQAVRLKPDYTEAHYNLGVALKQVGRVPEAIEHWEQAVRVKPDDTEAHYNLGVALWQVGRVPEAIAHYEQALRIKPDYAEAHNNLGVALWQVGRVPEAIAQYEQALRIRPDYAEAHNNLGFALTQVGRVQEAIGHYEQALRIKPDYAEAKSNLARLRAAQ